ncbi:MAG: hypothetical protein P8Z31_00065 [Gammaproteobacteria bacterium]|jgi:hypothetical protein
MKTRNIIAFFLLVLLTSTPAVAKDSQLEQDMIDLEQTYIPALFITGKPATPDQDEATLLAISRAKLAVYKASWAAFSDEYETYRASWRNWISYFHRVQELIDEADALLEADERLETHEVLEEIRTLMAEFRGRNGFPKFVVDQFTDFHTLMGEIIAVASMEFDDNTIGILSELYREASHAWSKVEQNSVDAVAWDLTLTEEAFYYDNVAAERVALDNFELALAYGDPAAIKAAALALKPPQASAYLTLGGVVSLP